MLKNFIVTGANLCLPPVACYRRIRSFLFTFSFQHPLLLCYIVRRRYTVASLSLWIGHTRCNRHIIRFVKMWHSVHVVDCSTLRCTNSPTNFSFVNFKNIYDYNCFGRIQHFFSYLWFIKKISSYLDMHLVSTYPENHGTSLFVGNQIFHKVSPHRPMHNLITIP